LSPHEILMGRPMQVPVTAPLTLKQMDIHMMDETMINFCVALTKVVKEFYSQVKQALPEPAAEEHHGIQPGDWVYIKVFKRKNALKARWTGPHQVLLVTNTAVRCKGKQSWTHTSHDKIAYSKP